MKRFFYFILFFFPIVSFAESIKEYKKILQKYDVIQLLPQESNGDALTFWKYVSFENQEFNSQLKKIHTKGGSAKKAREEIGRNVWKNRELYRSMSTLIPALDTLKYDVVGRLSYSDSTKIWLLIDDEKNAFSTPDLQVFICSGILKALPNDETFIPCMYALLAHEYAHAFLQHALFCLYNKYKRNSRNLIISSIALGAAVAHSTYSHVVGSESLIDVPNYKDNLINRSIRDTNMYYLKCSRDQEYQADIIAFRLLDWLGIGGENVITLLETISSPFDYYTSEEDDHPSIHDRIGLINYMLTQPRIIHKEK